MSKGGLHLRYGIWHIDKSIFGRRVRRSTHTSDINEAQLILAQVVQSIRQTDLLGERPPISFRLAGEQHLRTNRAKRSLSDDALHIAKLNNFIGDTPIHLINNATLKQFIGARKNEGVSAATVNHGLKVVRRILNQAACDWFIDGTNMTWIVSAPKIKLLPTDDSRLPKPITMAEQVRLLQELPDHLAEMALFKVNTGCRESEVCHLRWDWEYDVSGLESTVFIVPKEIVKNKKDRLIVLNSTASSIIETRRQDAHPIFVFTYKGKAISRMNNSAWRKARVRAELPDLRVHDLKHTFGRRLRAAGVSFEDRQDLLGHKSRQITTHYSAAEIQNLIDAAEMVASAKNQPELTLIRRAVTSRKRHG